MADTHRRILLPGPTDFEAFRQHARFLLASGIAPGQVEWQVAGALETSLFGEQDDASALPTLPAGLAPPAVPAAFIGLCRSVLLHSDPGRFGLLYRLLWRLVHEPALRHDPLDADRLQADLLAKAVRRDQHKMTAFVRFRPVRLPSADAADATLHTAWFEPEHHIVEATAPFFARRFARLHWAILSPRCSVRWFPPHEGRPGRLEVAPGGRREDAPAADAGESLWLTYYAHIFNPARLKIAMMQKEMPRKYWHNLPEAQLIGELVADAARRSVDMVDQSPTEPARTLRRLPPAPVAHAGPFAPLQSLHELKSAADRCRACPIGQWATQAVAGEGPAQAGLMVVGEQPGDHEDLEGRPFVGPAGQLFDRALAELGWQRERLYLTNAVKHFKFELRGKRRMHKTAGQREAAACHHWLEEELRMVAPQAILALGATAARAVLGRPAAVLRERGQWLQAPDGRPVLVTLHPSALLRADPSRRKEDFAAWLQDLALAEPYARWTG